MRQQESRAGLSIPITANELVKKKVTEVMG